MIYCPVSLNKRLYRPCNNQSAEHLSSIYSIGEIVSKNTIHLALFCFACLMVFDATFNTISVAIRFIGGGPGENYRPVTSHWQTLSHNRSRFELITSVVIGTDCIGSCKSYYHKITTAPHSKGTTVLLLFYYQYSYLILYINYPCSILFQYIIAWVCH